MPTVEDVPRSDSGASTVASPIAVRACLAFLAAGGLMVGAWATFAPQSFYSDFPGLGRRWVAVDGAYNQHLIGDVGALNLALTFMTVVAAVRLGPTLVRAVCGGWLIYSVPHLVYHVGHQGSLETADYAMEIASLSTSVVLPLVVLALTARRTASPHAPE